MPRYAEVRHQQWIEAPLPVVQAAFADVHQAVRGTHRGGSLTFRFQPQSVAGRAGTQVDIRIRLPLPPVLGFLVRPLLEAQIRKKLIAAALEDKAEIEQRRSRDRPRGAAHTAA